ncbi:hypothetical protein Tco_0282351 [Tanacetum coccineum]
MSDMVACVNDLRDIPPNNGQNEPTQRNIRETSNEPTQATTLSQRNEFEELYASANQERYPSCDFMTSLDFMTKFTHLKTLYKSNHTTKHMTWHATGKSMKNVEAPPIIPGDDDDFINDEDDVPYNLADSDNQVLTNFDDVEVANVVYSSDMAAEFARDEQRAQESCGDNYVGELMREFPMYYPSCHYIEEEKKAHIQGRLMQHFDLDCHILGPRWDIISQGIDDYFAKRFSDNKHNLKQAYWNSKGGVADVDAIRSQPPPNVERSD